METELWVTFVLGVFVFGEIFLIYVDELSVAVEMMLLYWNCGL